MGIIESTLGGLLHRLLMPKEVPDWYAGGRKSISFPKAPPDSLLLLGHIDIEVQDLEVAKLFYVDALGCCLSSVAGAAGLRVHVGPSQLRAAQRRAAAAAGPGRVWPGRFYLWVQDIRRTLDACRALEGRLGVTLVEDVHHVTADDSVDALELRDPDGHCFLVNEAPRALVEKLQKLAGDANPGSPPPNVLALVEALRLVPSGAAPGVARFYGHFLGAAVTPKDAGYAVHFCPAKALRQTLCFAEADEGDEEDDAADEPVAAAAGASTVCVYLPSAEKFRAAFDRCREAGIISEPTANWEEAERAREFRIQKCVDPRSQQAVLELETVVRLSDHPECSVPAEA